MTEQRSRNAAPAVAECDYAPPSFDGTIMPIVAAINQTRSEER